MRDNFTFLIAGPDHGSLKKLLKMNGNVAREVVVSRWENGGNPLTPPHAVVVSSNMPTAEFLSSLHNSQNIYLQATTVLAGLEKVETPYVVKLRSDEFFSNLSRVIDDFNPKKLLFANIFVRDVSYKAYHISDHLFVGRTDRLTQAFRSLKSYIEQNAGQLDPLGILNAETPAEVKIGLFYLQACGYQIEHLLHYSEGDAFAIMKNDFDVFDVDALRPFEISSSVAGRITNYQKFVGRDSVFGLRHITSIDQMSPQGVASRMYWRAVFKLKRLLDGSIFWMYRE